MTSFTCEQCGQSFKRPRSAERPIRFCGQPCYHAWRAENHIGLGQFRPGFIPWNKGLKGIHLSPASQFQPGHKLNEVYAVGTVTTRTDNNGKPRQHIKTTRGWEVYATWLWVQAYGPLIPGDVVHHLNGQHDDDRLDNLIALSRADHLKYHSRWGIKPVPADALAGYRNRYLAKSA